MSVSGTTRRKATLAEGPQGKRQTPPYSVRRKNGLPKGCLNQARKTSRRQKTGSLLPSVNILKIAKSSKKAKFTRQTK
jgi:hypothetical protein